MIDDTNTQRLERHITENEKTPTTPTTPRLGGILVTHVQESSSLSDSRVDDELDPNFTIHRFSGLSSDLSLGLHATVSAAEKSFKQEDYIYVSFSLSSYFRIFKIMLFFVIRLILRKETNGILSISRDARNGPSRL